MAKERIKSLKRDSSSPDLNIDVLNFMNIRESRYVEVEKQKRIQKRNEVMGIREDIHIDVLEEEEDEPQITKTDTNATETIESRIAKINSKLLDNLLISKISREKLDIKNYQEKRDFIATKIKKMAFHLMG